ncbi:MAG: RNA polymerase-associated protein RapA [Candidatus Hydrogenedentes bacterium ADurb.Bin179]|nr:MAG: RNA polymerase-associated protein RapA [Candidatus Hydrogenedentes bacterium ADurb.Bin179]
MLLRERDWQPTYSHEDGDLVDLFFLPALSCSKLYQRVTGYFNKEALTLASRGLDTLIRNEGRMQLIVGCTLEQEEVDAIEAGYAIRTLIEKGIHKRLQDMFATEWERKQLGWLSWMVAHNYLDIKLAIPKDADGKYRAGLGLYHAKAGLLLDAAGDKLAFRGSINETLAGWKQNFESFDVSCSWRGEWDLQRVTRTEDEFQTLWANKAKAAEVLEVPEAVKQELLQFLPKDDRFMLGPKIEGQGSRAEGQGSRAEGRGGKSGFKTEIPVPEPEAPVPGPEIQEPNPEARDPETETQDPEPDLLDPHPSTLDPRPPALDPKQVWAFIRDAAKRPNGALVAVKTCTVEPWPHQLKAYKRMLDTWPFRLLIADEVGLGKTIEAGLIIRHAWISGAAKRILILVPSALMTQWQAELYEKFNLLVPIYTGRSLVWPKHHFCRQPLEKKIPRDKWTEQPLVIASSHLMRRKDRQAELVTAENWDLLVVDEAHHARRRGAGTTQEKGPNRLLRLLLDIKDKASSLLMMTATPMQVHPVEIWDLLSVLGLPPEWDASVFTQYFDVLNQNPDEKSLHWLAHLFQATEAVYGPLANEALDRIADGFGLSRIERKSVVTALREKNSLIPIKRLNTKQRKAALALLRTASPVRYRMSRHTRTLLRQYARNGLLDSPIADRAVTDIAIEMAPGERALYEAVEEYISKTYQAATPGKRTAVGFVMTTYRRRVASSFHALRRTLEKKLDLIDAQGKPPVLDETQLYEDASQDELLDEVNSPEDTADLEQDALAFEQKETIRSLLKSIARLGTDSKALRLITELNSVFAEGYGGAIIFTQYADTMEFLKDFVAERVDLPIGCFSGEGGQRREPSGAWGKCSKEEIKRLLRTNEIKVLICTDAAGEGLNLQSCGVLVNYDLPWNPMKVEQRIGRIDRIGQVHPTVRIINLGYADTVEVDVYFALHERIGLFTGVVGKLQPILSRLPKEFEAAILTGPEQREQARHKALSNVNVLVDEAEAAGFDIDEVSEADLQPPEFPDPPFVPSDLDIVLHDASLLPASIECRELEPSTYALRMPGEKELARITTSPGIFDEHFESHQLLLPDSPLFKALLRAADVTDIEEEPIDTITLRELIE